MTDDTLEQFQKFLPFTELSANFKDAIIITRQLGIRYLWIDSLCIIQSSRRDWEIESKRMGHVYGNATVTLSAMASHGSKGGILKNIPVDLSPPPAEIPIASNNHDFVAVSRHESTAEDLGMLHNQGPLQSRGWTLQEFVLSPRHLFYGAHQIYWKCAAGEYPGLAEDIFTPFTRLGALPTGLHTFVPVIFNFHKEVHHLIGLTSPSHALGYLNVDGSTRGLRFPHNSYDDVAAVLSSGLRSDDEQEPVPSPDVILQEYYRLITAYSERNLTVASDKLPAFSGLAQGLHGFLRGTFMPESSCKVSNGLSLSTTLLVSSPQKQTNP